MDEYSWHDFPNLTSRIRELVKEFPDKRFDLMDVMDWAVMEANDCGSVDHEEELALQSLDEMVEEWRESNG